MRISRTLTASMLAMMNVGAICNTKNFPMMAEYGLASIYFLILAALIFLMPVAFVSAELATGWPDRGVYTWVKEGLNQRFGFFAIWLQWIENVTWYPTILSFIAATFAYTFMPELAQNKLYVLSMILGVFWAATFMNFFGMQVSGWLSFVSAIFGTIFPIVLIIGLGILWIARGYPSQISFSWNGLIPKFHSIRDLVLLVGFVFNLTGLEMTAVHAKDVKNPQRDYPRAIFLSALIIILLSIFGSLTISMIVPLSQIKLTTAGIETMSHLFHAFHLSWAVPIIAGIIAFGAFGMMSSWLVGPSRGLLATALDGDLPPLLQKKNRHGMPVPIFIMQALLVTLLSFLFLYMPSVSISYWILIALTSNLYMVMYILMFIAAIRLRYTKPFVFRAYRVPGGKVGIWLVSGMGILCALTTIGISLFPPSQFDSGSTAVYELILIGGMMVFTLPPLLIFQFRKSSWKQI